jgi:MSHA pilin protein MshD
MKPRQTGYSLLELVVFIVIVGVAVGAISLQFSQNVQHSHEPFLRQRALAVAGAYLDEIMDKRWNENTPIGGGCVDTASPTCTGGPAPTGIGSEEGSRALYDDVDDYNGLSDSPPQDSQGNNMANYGSGFQVDVAVTQPGAAWNGINANDVRRIEVQVQNPTGETISLVAYRVNN